MQASVNKEYRYIFINSLTHKNSMCVFEEYKDIILSLIFWFFMQVENLKAIHPDYGNRVQTLLNKYNVEAQKVNAVPVQSNKKSPSK